MAGKRRSKTAKTPKRRSGKNPGSKGGGGQTIAVFAFVMAVIAFAIWHNHRPEQASLSVSAPIPVVKPAVPVRPAVAPKPATAVKSAERAVEKTVAKPAEAAKPPKQAEKPGEKVAAKPAEAAKTVKPKKEQQPGGIFAFFFRPVDLDARTAPVFRQFGLTKESLVRRLSIEKQSGDTRYYRTYAEYEVRDPLKWRDFVPALERVLKGTPFRINSVGRRSRGAFDVYTLSINRDDLNVMRLEIRSKKTVAPAPAGPARRGPKVAIVIDDFGYSMNNIGTFLDIGKPLTIAVLPHQQYSARVAALARSRGFEVILHLPLEAQRSDATEEADTIRSSMSDAEIETTLAREFTDVPGAIGANNHQGSKGTEDPRIMTVILRYLKARNLFFLDSLTSSKSVGRDVAAHVGIRYARRTQFLDNNSDPAAIEAELRQLKTVAASTGKAIAICHDRKNTAAVLARMMPELAAEGIEFVYLSEMER